MDPFCVCPASLASPGSPALVGVLADQRTAAPTIGSSASGNVSDERRTTTSTGGTSTRVPAMTLPRSLSCTSFAALSPTLRQGTATLDSGEQAARRAR
jgi:hypothetical protein